MRRHRDHSGRRGRGAGGYAIALTALLLIPMLGAASVAVDLGSRYAEAAKIQRAADAAALAGVTVLPRGESAARVEARQVAARNGYDDAAADVTVQVDQVGPESLKVTITLTDVPEYFGGVFSGDSHLTRTATAKYVRAVSLGSPRNFLGTGDLIGTAIPRVNNDMEQFRGRTVSQTRAFRENYWLAISGRCSSRENGDRFNTISQANFRSTTNPPPTGGSAYAGCDPGASGFVQSNPEFRESGYIYAVHVPAGYNAGLMKIEAYDPALCAGTRPGDGDDRDMETTYTIRTGSPDPLGGTVVQTYVDDRGSSGCDSWVSLYNVIPPTAGATYFIQVTASRNSNAGTATNGFSLRAHIPSESQANQFFACSSDPKDSSIYEAWCPQVYAVQDMGVFASLKPVGSTSTKAEFFLAEVGREYEGKQLEITLFDPGEGAKELRIKEPDGSYATFDWEVDCPAGVTQPTGGCSGTNASKLDLVGTVVGCDRPDTAGGCSSNPQPGFHRTSGWKYNERSLKLTIDLPSDIGSAYGGATWWKVEYTTGESPTDRTTWSVEVKGDPVRLIPNPPPPEPTP